MPIKHASAQLSTAAPTLGLQPRPPKMVVGSISASRGRGSLASKPVAEKERQGEGHTDRGGVLAVLAPNNRGPAAAAPTSPRRAGPDRKFPSEARRPSGGGRKAGVVVSNASTASKGAADHNQAGLSRWQQVSTSSVTGSKVSGEVDSGSGTQSRFAVEDAVGTRRAIQNEWKRGKKTKDVLAACARINAFLDNPLFSRDEERAAVTVQRMTRGWLLRLARQRGTLLFPVEAQALADGRVLLYNDYGAQVYSWSPQERRLKVVTHFSAKLFQRAWRGYKARAVQVGQENSYISLGPEDSLLDASAQVKFIDFACSEEEALSAVTLLQRAARCHRARKRCVLMRLRLSKAVHFLRFLSSELSDAMTSDAARIRNAAAVRMQASWRGACCRKKLKGSRGVQSCAAVTMQKNVRGWNSRRKMARIHGCDMDRLLLKRVLRWWNKIMWTVYSPGKSERAPSSARNFEEEEDMHIQHEQAEARTPRQQLQPMSLSSAARPSKTARGEKKEYGGQDADEDGGSQRSLWVEETEDCDSVVLAPEMTPRQSEDEAPRQSWQVVEGTEGLRGMVLVPVDLSHATRHGDGVEAAPKRVSATRWPEAYSASVCCEPGALKQAMLTDSSAVRIQRAVRAYMASRFGGGTSTRPVKKMELTRRQPPAHQQTEGSQCAETPQQTEKTVARTADVAPSHVTPPAGGQGFFGGTPGGVGGGAGAGLGLPPTPYRAGRSPPAASLLSPVRKTPPGNAGLPPMTPVHGGVCGVEREQVLSAWKKGIENQVSIIHEQLLDSARKASSARSRSRSPPPGSPEKQLQFDPPIGRASPFRSNSSSPTHSPLILYKDPDDRGSTSLLVPPLALECCRMSTRCGEAMCKHDMGTVFLGTVDSQVGQEAPCTSQLARASPPRRSPAPHTPSKVQGADARGMSPSRPVDRIELRSGTGRSRSATRSPYDASPGRVGSRGGKGREAMAPSPARTGTIKCAAVGSGGRAKGLVGSAGSTAGAAVAAPVAGHQSTFRRPSNLQHGGPAAGNLKMMPLPALPSPS